MDESTRSETSQILLDLAQAEGDDRALVDRLFSIVYGELHRSAAALMRSERADHTLRPTALVHEAYLKLVDGRRVQWHDRKHFYAAAAQAMRRILVDHARRRSARKRGGGNQSVTFEESMVSVDNEGVDVLRLDTAMGELFDLNARVARVAELHVFAGVPVPQIARLLGTSRRTAYGDWAFARKWLSRALT